MRQAFQNSSQNIRQALPGLLAGIADVLRYTRYWILYGICALAVVSALIGAVESVLGI